MVAAVGDDVTGWQPGQECAALLSGGGYATRVAVPAAQVLPAPLGPDLTTTAGVVETAATVLSNFDLAGVGSSDCVLVHGGAGGVGSFAIQYAHHLGARVVATAGSDEKLAYCRSIGADVAVSYDADWPAAVADFTAGRGADVILDVVGAKYLERHLQTLAPDGRLVVIGLQGGRRARLDLAALMAKRGQLLATTLRSRPVEQKASICAAVTYRVWPLLASGAIQPAPQTRFALSEAAEAHRLLESGASFGKIVLVVENS